MTLLLAMLLAAPPPSPPSAPPTYVVAVDGGSTLTVSCVNCSGGGGGGGTSSVVYVLDAGVLNVNPVRIASAPAFNIADAGTLNINPVAIASMPVLFIQDAGTLNVNFPASQAVTGTFWQATQNVYVVDAGPPLNVNPVAIASLPLVFVQDAGTLNINLPPGAATSAKQDTGNTSLANLDVALSTRTKPADQQHVIIDTMTPNVTVVQATASNLNVTASQSGAWNVGAQDGGTLLTVGDYNTGIAPTGANEFVLTRRTLELILLEQQQQTLLLQKLAGAYPGANP